MQNQSLKRATLFGISHIDGLVQAHRDAADFSRSAVDVPPWVKGEFTSHEGVNFSYVSGWWDKRFIGDVPSFQPDGSILCSKEFLKLIQHVEDRKSNCVFFQLAAVDAYSANELINLGPYDIAPKWDFSFGASLVAEGRSPVRKKDVDLLIRSATRNILASCLAAQSFLKNSNLYYVFPPPPVESSGYIIEKARAAVNHHHTYAERYQLLVENGVRPFSIRKKLIDLANEQLKNSLRNHGIDFVDPPADCLLASGALNLEYAHDMHHGNVDYNKRMIEKISHAVIDGVVAGLN